MCTLCTFVWKRLHYTAILILFHLSSRTASNLLKVKDWLLFDSKVITSDVKIQTWLYKIGRLYQLNVISARVIPSCGPKRANCCSRIVDGGSHFYHSLPSLGVTVMNSMLTISLVLDYNSLNLRLLLCFLGVWFLLSGKYIHHWWRMCGNALCRLFRSFFTVLGHWISFTTHSICFWQFSINFLFQRN